MIIDGHVNIFPSSVADMLAANSMDAMADRVKTAQFFDVQMQQVAGAGVLVATRQRRRIEVAKTADSQALQDAPDRGRTQLRFVRNAATGPTLATKGLHMFDQSGSSGPIQAVRTRTAIPAAPSPR